MLIVVGNFGRLGNQLWTHANSIAFALENRLRLLDTCFVHSDLFRGKEGLARELQDTVVPPDSPMGLAASLGYRLNLRARAYPSVQLGEGGRLRLEADRNREVLVTSRFAFLSGLFVSAPGALERNFGMLKAYFDVKNENRTKAESLIALMRSICDVVIGVHIRHGDYRTYNNGLMFYTAAELAAVMRGIVQQVPDQRVGFVVCSDEIQDLSVFAGLSVRISDGDAVNDIHLLSCCDYIVGPYSSFSQWASFVGQVPLYVVDYKNAFLEGREVRNVPSLKNDFSVFAPSRFGEFATHDVNL